MKKEFFSACDSWNRCGHLAALLRTRATLREGQTQKMSRHEPVPLYLEATLAVE